MKKNSKARSKGNTKALRARASNLRLIDLGVCVDFRCPNYEETDTGVIPHYHGMVYTDGLADDLVIEAMKKILKETGFVGELEVEHMSRKHFAELHLSRRIKKESEKKVGI